jgi:ornithine decarboxylase
LAWNCSSTPGNKSGAFFSQPDYNPIFLICFPAKVKIVSVSEQYSSVEALLQELNPAEPVYCIYPHVYARAARNFIEGFPGRVLYAVKACSEPAVLKILSDAGVRHFDCASLAEIAAVSAACGDVRCYFMVPVRTRGEARTAQQEFGVRHFLVDHTSGIERLESEIDIGKSVVFARMAVHHASAMHDLSTRFGSPVEEIPSLIDSIAATGAEPALAFNVGSMVTSPEAYRHSIAVARKLLTDLPRKIRLVDIGGGYPRSYPRFAVPPLNDYFESIREAAAQLPLADGGEILGEPGRALAAPGMSAISEILQRKGDRLYINDGMHGIFWDLRYEGHNQYACRCYRDGQRLKGNLRPFTLYGPTCDSKDVLPEPVDLPDDIRPGDHLEFGGLGAYSLSGRTDFNGRYSEHIVMIDSPEQYPPGDTLYNC